jgi:hypothetical protein
MRAPLCGATIMRQICTAPATEWVVETAPWGNLKFVPPNCTSVAQPMDVGIQKPFKDRLLRDAVSVYVIRKMIQHNPLGQRTARSSSSCACRNSSRCFVGKAWEDLSAQRDTTRNAWSQPRINECFGRAMQMETATLHGAGKLFPEGLPLVTVTPEGMVTEEDPGVHADLDKDDDAMRLLAGRMHVRAANQADVLSCRRRRRTPVRARARLPWPWLQPARWQQLW